MPNYQSQMTVYPKLEETPIILDQKELFCERLPYPIAKSYFHMLNSTGQRRFSYFLETFELALYFYYYIFATFTNQKITEAKLSLGKLLFFTRKLAKEQRKEIEYREFSLAFENNYSCFQKLIKLRNINWAHGNVKNEADYDLKYLANCYLLNRLLLPLLNEIGDYFAVREVLGFREKEVLVRGLQFLGANPFPRQKLLNFRRGAGQIESGMVYLKLSSRFLDLSRFIFFHSCEVCHLDSHFLYKDQFAQKKHLTRVFLCVNCGARGTKPLPGA